MPSKENDLKEIFLQSHDVFRHSLGYVAPEILETVKSFMEKDINEETFIKKTQAIELPLKIKSRILFKSRNIFK